MMSRMVSRALSRTADRVWTRASLAGATSVGSGARVVGHASIVNQGTLVIGPSAILVASPSPVQIVVEPGASLTIGEAAVLESGVRVRVSHDVRIGTGARIGAGCLIDDGDGVSASSAHEGGAVIEVGAGAWIEDGATLLAGARIAPGASVPAGAVVHGAREARGNDFESADDAIVSPVSSSHEAAVPAIRALVTRIVRSAANAAPDEDLRALPGWDSLAALRVLVSLEETFGVTLPTDLFAHPRGLDALAALTRGDGAPVSEHAREAAAAP